MKLTGRSYGKQLIKISCCLMRLFSGKKLDQQPEQVYAEVSLKVLTG